MMPFLVDFHIHSHFSIATSKACNPENLFLWACLKGLTVIGTGDFTHPGWLEELDQKLIPAEEGLYRLKPDIEKAMLEQIPKTCQHEVRFILSSEISSIYKKGGKVRKVHNCLLVPSIYEARAISQRLEQIGNIRADGRPILGLDSRHLLEIMLDKAPKGLFIPAHVWTPHFSLFGAYSGFDSLEECFEDLSSHIWALETGLSSDPSMNWQVSALDRYTLVSNSDAHSPKNLAREANIFGCERSFPAIRTAIKDKDLKGFLGTVEFFPEEGKYHFDGHRNCGIRLDPEETIQLNGICPRCGKKLTLGVMHRVVELADRSAGFVPEGASPFHSLIPLPEILADYIGCRVQSKKVSEAYFNLINKIGPEWQILMLTPIESLKRYAGPSLAEGIERVRSGRISIKPGFDGEYGTISVFSPKERMGMKGQKSLFQPEELPIAESPKPAAAKTQKGKGAKRKKPLPSSTQSKSIQKKSIPSNKGGIGDQLNPAQLRAVQAKGGPILVIAGPGTGKTRTLAFRIAWLIKDQGVKPEEIIAITFTNKASREMAERLESVLEKSLSIHRPFIGTFHHFCLELLKKYGHSPLFTLFHTYDNLALIELILKKSSKSRKSRDCLQKISFLKTRLFDPNPEENADPFIMSLFEEYQRHLQKYHALDYDDLLIHSVKLLTEEKTIAREMRSRYKYILVDEFQDVNPIQYRLILLLADPQGKNLFLIGDPNQSIYGFRGADDRLFFRIQEEFPQGVIFSLEENYRSTSPIIDSARHLISRNPQPLTLNLKSIRGNGPVIKEMEFPSEKAEGIAIAKEITALMGGIDMLQAHGEKGHGNVKDNRCYGFSDFAVLFRTGNQADILEECLIKEGIPYRLAGHMGIMENSLVRQILAFLRWCRDPMDEHSLHQVLNLPILKSFPDVSQRIKQGFKDASESNMTAQRISNLQLPKPFSSCPDLAKESSPSQFIDHVISILEDNDHCKASKRDLNRLSLLAEEFPDVSSFLDTVSLYREGDIAWKGKKGERTMEMVSLMTLHAAKGLEFPVVFICGCETGLLPYGENHEDANLHEERRLFYVGMTRAKDRLYLSWCQNRIRKGIKCSVQISPFLKEIPEDFYEKIVFTPTSTMKSRNKQLSLW